MLEDCTALTIGTCLMDEHITILIINPYYDLRSVQTYVSDSPPFPIHSPLTRTWPSVTPSKGATYLYCKRIPYKFIPLVQSWIPPRCTVTFWRSFRALASDSASYKRFAFLRLSSPLNIVSLLPVKIMSAATRQYMPPNGRLQTTNLVRNFHPQSGRFI